MQTYLHGRDLIGDLDFSKEEVETVLDVAFDLKRKRALNEPHAYLRDKVLAMLFFFLVVLYAYARVLGLVLGAWLDPVAQSLPGMQGAGPMGGVVPLLLMGLAAFPGGALMLATVLFSLLLTGVGVALFEAFAEA